MTHDEIFGGAKWLCPPGSPEAALFRSMFNAKKAQNAEITICGLGYFTLYINGKKVGDDEFTPAYSDYHDRPEMTLTYPLNDRRTHRIYCMKYDISKLLTDGVNIIGASVGGGFYRQLMRTAEGNVSYGDIKLCYKITVDGEEFLSDENVKWQRGFVKFCNLFYGEKHDYTGFDRLWNTLEASPEGWQSCPAVEAPESEYYIWNFPTDKVTEALKPELVKNFGDYSVYRVEKNISGYPVFTCAKAGERVRVECAEELDGDLNIDNTSVGNNVQRQIFEFVADGNAAEYHPCFTWFGFRCFSVTNNAVPTEVRVVHSDVGVSSDFICSDETLNWYYRTFLNTQLCNMHGCIPSDCPHRERLGYTGDGQLACGAVMTQFDAEGFYRKWIADIWDCQDKNTGHVQHTAPFAGGGGGPAGWGGAIITVPYNFYRHYGDKRALRALYPNMALFVKYMESRCENGLIVREEKGGWCLGDWCTPQKIALPEPFVNTAMYINQLKMMAYVSRELGLDGEVYELLARRHARALADTYRGEDGSFIKGVQGADAFACECGAADERAFERLVEKYSALGEFDTGIFGTYSLLNVLYSRGQGGLATALLANKGQVSFDFMRRSGATTLWENWNGADSHSHPMFGASTLFLFRNILGIRQKDNSVRYDRVVIEPVFAESLTFAKGHITTPHGKIAVSWKRESESTEVEIDLCGGVEAQLIAGGKTLPLKHGKNKFTV